MCNYYSRTRGLEHVELALGIAQRTATNYPPHVVVRPTHSEHVARRRPDGQRELVEMRWGLVPLWAPDIKSAGYTMTNARAEEIMGKKSYKPPFLASRRCLVPADGYIESTGPAGKKTHHFFHPVDGSLLVMAGLWEAWPGPKAAPLAEPLLSYTICTHSPNRFASQWHDRMPAVLTREQQDRWLDPGETPAGLIEMLREPVAEDMLTMTTADPDILRLKIRPTVEMLYGRPPAAADEARLP